MPPRTSRYHSVLSWPFALVLAVDLVQAGINDTTPLDLVHTRLEIDAVLLAAKSSPLRLDMFSLSIEFGNTIDFLGDIGKPNEFTRQLIRNVAERTKAAPMIRLGGNTQDKSEFCADCRNGTMVNVFEGEGPLSSEATKVTYNADLFRVMSENSLATQEYIFGLNFGADNVTIPRTALAGALSNFNQSRIHSYELGNEVNLYGAFVPYRPKTWTVLNYASEIMDWYSQFTTLIEAHAEQYRAKYRAGFQFGSFVGPPYGFPDFNHVQMSTMHVPQRIGGVKAIATHGYPNNICTPRAANATTLTTYLNHLQTVAWVTAWSGEIAVAKANGFEYHIGETGSAGCHGKPGVSDTFGAALWVLDYTLTAATFGVDRIFFHNGKGGFVYNMWEPSDTVLSNGTVTASQGVRPSYYSMLFVADLIKGVSSPRIARLEQYDTSRLAHFAVFDDQNALRKLALVSTGLGDGMGQPGTATNQPRSGKNVDVSMLLGKQLTLLRLTGSSVNATSGVSWANQTINKKGVLIGDLVQESVDDGIVRIKAGEAVIVEA
ncbi:hypothetical protein OPT61_g1806 [Boeremia exigua]|uniref:Uncharacterized protein n=1 Tax=Boeremia exigua TaxID=749465 RepID=A0ACC2IP24_9PLEO|nr:hypothetical protein OPT61_g1806 [Boeremia exigua]